MVFSSTIFLLLFLPTVLFFYFCVPKKWRTIHYKNIILLISSLLFYAWGEPFFVFLMLLSIYINWQCGKYIEKQNAINKKLAKRCLVIIISLDVLLIFIFKYLNFVLSNMGWMFEVNWKTNIALPIGISFFTFQIMSYVFDIYYGKVKSQRKLLDVALYISLFPQLIAGPIVQYSTIAKEIQNRKETWGDFSDGLFRFIIGLGKKVLIANYMAIIADNHFNVQVDTLSVSSAWLGAIAYSLQIYFDFSGYSDMAIGLGRIFGFHFKENFNYPYIATSVTDFWRRWHISLTSWFREYVYYPLGGNRNGVYRTILNTSIVWMLTGIWHGANWTFIVWGIFYLLILLTERYLKLNKREWKSYNKIFAQLITFAIVTIGWVIFRADNLAFARDYISTMFGQNGVFIDDGFSFNILNGWFVFLIAIIFIFPIKGLFNKFQSKIIKYGTFLNLSVEILLNLFLLFIFLFSLISIIKSTYNPFIYFNF